MADTANIDEPNTAAADVQSPAKSPLAEQLDQDLAAVTQDDPDPATDTGDAPHPEMKDETMDNEMNEQMNQAATEMQQRSHEAYSKSTEMMGEMSDSAQGNMQAVVESGKIFSTGMQDLARTYVEDAKSTYEQMTADLREMAAVKSPTELLQLQGKIMRRNFDTMVSATSKNTERMMKLSNDAFAPISARMSVAADKVVKAD